MNQVRIQFIDTIDYSVHFATPYSFLNILHCRALSKLSIGTNVVLLGQLAR